MPEAQGRPVKLGEHEYFVFPQKIGYLMNKLGPRLQEALEAELAGVDGIKLIGVKAHDFLKVFIPDLMPVHEFLGFASAEALAEGASGYNEALDHSPDAPQIEAAIEAVKSLNGGAVLDVLKAVAKMAGPKLTEAAFALITAKVGELGTTSPISAPSPTSPPESGGSALTSSGTTPPTSVPSPA